MNASARFALLTLIAILIAMAAVVVITQFVTVGNFAFDPQSIPFYSVAGAVGLVLWGLIQLIGRSAISAARTSALAEGAATSAGSAAKAMPVPKPEPAKPAPPPVDEAALIASGVETGIETGAAQILTILQRKGRLMDFLQEDLSAYEDAQVGAAVRSIHQGCKDALAESVALEPIFEEAEGSNVTVKAGFDAKAIRLSGNVAGDPPFTGALRHRGWQIKSFSLPKKTGSSEPDKVIAAAEIEVN